MIMKWREAAAVAVVMLSFVGVLALFAGTPDTVSGRPIWVFTQIDPNMDTKTTGNGTTLDSEAAWRCLIRADFQGFTGGTTPNITFKSQHSPNGSTWIDLVTEAVCTGVCVKTQVLFCGSATTCSFRYVRWTWTTTGAPTAAPTHFYLQCRGT